MSSNDKGFSRFLLHSTSLPPEKYSNFFYKINRSFKKGGFFFFKHKYTLRSKKKIQEKKRKTGLRFLR